MVIIVITFIITLITILIIIIIILISCFLPLLQSILCLILFHPYLNYDHSNFYLFSFFSLTSIFRVIFYEKLLTGLLSALEKKKRFDPHSPNKVATNLRRTSSTMELSTSSSWEPYGFLSAWVSTAELVNNILTFIPNQNKTPFPENTSVTPSLGKNGIFDEPCPPLSEEVFAGSRP